MGLLTSLHNLFSVKVVFKVNFYHFMYFKSVYKLEVLSFHTNFFNFLVKMKFSLIITFIFSAINAFDPDAFGYVVGSGHPTLIR